LGGLPFRFSLGKKFTKLHLNHWLGAVVCSCHLATQEAQIGASQSRPAWAEKGDSIQKITKVKGAGHGSSGRLPAWQVQGTEFKPQYTK
jgi:hypothetical protein